MIKLKKQCDIDLPKRPDRIVALRISGRRKALPIHAAGSQQRCRSCCSMRLLRTPRQGCSCCSETPPQPVSDRLVRMLSKAGKKSAFEACRSMRSSSCDDRPGKAIAGVPPLHGYLILREMQWDLPHSQKVLWDPQTVAEWDISSLPSPRLSGFSLKVETNCPTCDEEMKDGSPRSSKGLAGAFAGPADLNFTSSAR